MAKVYIERENTWKQVDFLGTGEELLVTLEINPQTVLMLKDGVLVPESESMDGAEEIKILTVVSGG